MDRLLHFTDDDPAVGAEATPSVEQAALGLRRDGRWAVAFVRPTHTHGISLMLRGDDTLLRELVRSSPFASWSVTVRQAPLTAIDAPWATSAVVTSPRTVSRLESAPGSMATTSPSSSMIPVNISGPF